MAEICTPLGRLAPGETFTASDEDCFVITPKHSHNDILRYIADDVGVDHLRALVQLLPITA